MAIISNISQIHTPTISQIILLFGSNFDSENIWVLIKQYLQTMGECYFSTINISPDYTKKTNFIYHNACILIKLHTVQNHQQINNQLKSIEVLCGRNKSQNDNNKIHQVTADLDILAVYTDNWHISKKRLPFKDHEITGLMQIGSFLFHDLQ